MSFWRPFRRPNRNLGTLGGNPSLTDEVVAEGPPVIGDDVEFGLWNEERAAAVHADLGADIASDFDREARAENSVWDSLGTRDADAGGAPGTPVTRAPEPPEPVDFNGA
jgi:hypothetical protein